MRKLVVIFYICLVGATGCSHRGISQNETFLVNDLTPVKLNNPRIFEISGTRGYTEKQKLFYKSHQKTYEGKQLAHEREELTEFTVENEIVAVSTDPSWIELRQKTLEKSGPADLNQMAYPEVGESIVFRYGKSGDVLKAGKFPEFSIFYVAPMPLPKTPMQVGDTWKYQASWIDYNQGIEMSIDLVGILKNAFSCYEREVCLDLEYSGNIMLPEKLQEVTKFRGTVVARFLLRPKNFSILRSEIYNKEFMAREDNTMDIKSCIVSEIASTKTLSCNP